MSNTLPTPLGSEEIVYKGKLIEIVHQEMQARDKQFTIEKARRAPGTRLLIISPDKKILLTQEYRMELKNWDTRLPGGKVFDSLDTYTAFLQSGKDILATVEIAAKKEAREEVGLEIDEIKYFTTSTCGATITWDLYYFVVNRYHSTSSGQELELGENIKLTWVDLEKAKQMCLDGTIQEDRTAAVLMRFLYKVI